MGLCAEAVYLYNFFNFGARIGGWSMQRTGPYNSKKGARYTLYWTINGPLFRSGVPLQFLYLRR